MTPERWQQVTAVFQRAIACAPPERTALLGEACGSDATLRAEVESLLAVYDEPSDTLESPLVTELPAETHVLLGEMLDGKYRIEELLGRGGMGEVYRATHVQLERDVAVKVIRADRLGENAAVERFVREARMVARLRHPEVVTIHDFGVAAGVGAYLVMELLEGRSLRAELRDRKRLELRQALEIFAKVCSAIDAAHRVGVIHRDIKPDNVFLERGAAGPTVKVLDFGLAKIAGGTGSLDGTVTNRGAVLGTPAYMAPEQCRGGEADARSDIYALGCLLYEMVTGRPPFVGSHAAAVLYLHVHEPPVPPSATVPGIDPAIDAAILSALAKSPEDRPRSAEALARALGIRIAANRPDTLPPIDDTSAGIVFRTGALEAQPTGAFAPTNLRSSVTRFVGRQNEIDDVRNWLARTRLITLVGPGGIGKTRLASETGSVVLDDYRDGVWFVELAGLADASLVGRAVASALGVREPSERSVDDGLVEWLRPKELLLVLDNCEHLVDACARLVERLLEGAPGFHVLATSREALGLNGEAVWPVPALSVPASGDDAVESEAVTLFVDRASLARPGFALTAANREAIRTLCQKLEGLPLAIELAAARVKSLGVEQILERLDDRLAFLSGGSRTTPARHRAIQATLDWSLALLTDLERVVFRRLSVFAGGWDLDAAEAVCAGDDLPASDVLSVLARLVDKSLVTVHEPGDTTRYGMLEMVRAYGADRLSESGEGDDVRRRHADFYHEQAQAARRAIWSGHSAAWLARLEVEHDNVRAALAWRLEHDADGCLEMATAVGPFRELHGHLAESRRCLEKALARGEAAPVSARVEALISVGMVASLQGDLAAARAFYERGLELSRESGVTDKVGHLSLGLGAVVSMQGDQPAARGYLGESLELGRQTGNDGLVSQSLVSLGEVARLERAWSAAREFIEKAIAMCREKSHDHALVVALCNLGAVLCETGDFEAARRCYDEALTVSRALRSTEFIGMSLDGLGAVAAACGAWDRAARLAGAAEAYLDESGAKLAPVDLAFRERYLAAVREHLDDATFEAAFTEGRRMTADDFVRDHR